MKEFKVSEELATAVLNYLAGRPYVEVFQLVNALQKLEEIKQAETADDK